MSSSICCRSSSSNRPSRLLTQYTTNVDSSSANKFLYYKCIGKPYSNQWASKPPKMPLAQVLSNTPFLNPTTFTIPNGSSITSHVVAQQCYKITNYPLVTMEPHILSTPKNCPLPRGDQHRHPHCISDPSNPPTQTAARSSQPIFRRSPDRHTDREEKCTLNTFSQ